MQADRGVCAALERELQAQEQAVEEALKQEDEQQAGPSSARNACATAEGSNGPSDFSGAGPSHGKQSFTSLYIPAKPASI